MALLFLSTALPKIYRYVEFTNNIENYKVLPSSLVKPIAIFDIIVKCLIFIFLVMNVFVEFFSYLAIGLLIAYTFAIILNLLRGRTSVDCGCGGLVGDNTISWNMAFRNILLIAVMVFLIKNPINIKLSIDLLPLYGSATVIMAIIIAYQKYKLVNGRKN